jgi:hypothetical protein
MRKVRVDWQMVVYGEAADRFTNREAANDSAKGRHIMKKRTGAPGKNDETLLGPRGRSTDRSETKKRAMSFSCKVFFYHG